MKKRIGFFCSGSSKICLAQFMVDNSLIFSSPKEFYFFFKLLLSGPLIHLWQTNELLLCKEHGKIPVLTSVIQFVTFGLLYHATSFFGYEDKLRILRFLCLVVSYPNPGNFTTLPLNTFGFNGYKEEQSQGYNRRTMCYFTKFS